MLRFDALAASPGAAGDGPEQVLYLHGLGDSRLGWQPVHAELALPGCGGIFAEAPLAYPEDGPFGWSWFDLLPGPRADADQVDAHRRVIEDLIAHLGIDTRRLAVVGFSQGGLMALELALCSAMPLHRVVAVSGWLDRPQRFPAGLSTTARGQRILCCHGTQDPIVPYHLARPALLALREHGIDLRWRGSSLGHGIDLDTLAAIRAFLNAAPAPA